MNIGLLFSDVMSTLLHTFNKWFDKSKRITRKQFAWITWNFKTLDSSYFHSDFLEWRKTSKCMSSVVHVSAVTSFSAISSAHGDVDETRFLLLTFFFLNLRLCQCWHIEKWPTATNGKFLDDQVFLLGVFKHSNDMILMLIDIILNAFTSLFKRVCL